MADDVKAIRAGNAVLLEWEARDMTKDVPPLFDPGTYVKLTLYRPDRSKAVDAGSMSRVRTGVYRLVHQTVPDDAPDDVGLWTMEVEANNGGVLSLSKELPAFTLEA